MCSKQNDVDVCQKSCKLVEAFWRYEQSNIVASDVGPPCTWLSDIKPRLSTCLQQLAAALSQQQHQYQQHLSVWQHWVTAARQSSAGMPTDKLHRLITSTDETASSLLLFMLHRQLKAMQSHINSQLLTFFFSRTYSSEQTASIKRWNLYEVPQDTARNSQHCIY